MLALYSVDPVTRDELEIDAGGLVVSGAQLQIHSGALLG